MIVSLREFPAMPASGDIDMVEWIQSMGKITLSYNLDDASVTEGDIEVKLAGFQIEVKIKGEKVKALSGDLVELVWPAPRSWWMLHSTEGSATLVIQLSKQTHKAWPGIWFVGTMHPKKKGRFWWNVAAKALAEDEEKQIKLNQYETIPAGRPIVEDSAWYPPTELNMFSPISDSYTCSADDLVVGINSKQDKNNVYVYVHLENEALKFFTKGMTYEDLFAADISANSVSCFLRGDDQNPIITATFTGYIAPELATWKMTTEETFRTRQKNTSGASPAIMITLPKAEGQSGDWTPLFESCWQHRLMISNIADYEDIVDALEELKYIENPTDGFDPSSIDPEYKSSLKEKASKLDEWKEERYDGMPEGKTYRRQGYDIESPDYWENVYDYVKETMKRDGYMSGPKAIVVA